MEMLIALKLLANYRRNTTKCPKRDQYITKGHTFLPLDESNERVAKRLSRQQQPIALAPRTGSTDRVRPMGKIGARSAIRSMYGCADEEFIWIEGPGRGLAPPNTTTGK